MGLVQEARENHVKKKVEEGEIFLPLFLNLISKNPTLNPTVHRCSINFHACMCLCEIGCLIEKINMSLIGK